MKTLVFAATALAVTLAVCAEEQRTLADFVKAAQAANVRVSYGTSAGECCTDDDLKQFADVPATVVAKLKDDAAFLRAVQALADLSAEDRVAAIRKARSTFKQTWAQIGRICPEGQTDAGQTAEKRLADAISDLAEKLVAGGSENLRTMLAAVTAK